MNTLKTLLTAKNLLLAALLAPISLFAQTSTTGRVTGTIGDENKQPVESATITLLNAKDSSSAGKTASDKTGHFEFLNIGDGKYLVSASSVGHTTSYTPPFEVAAGQAIIILKPLFLKNTIKDLKEVSIVGKKPFLEQKADRMVVNVDASPSNAGTTAMDVLEKSPGVTVDKDDNIALKGKQNVTIMIDNKPTYMSSAQLASYLRGLPSSAIDQIEIMTNPSARYDAAGNSGIINLKTKKNKTKGFNGSITLSQTQGVYPKPSGSLNLNYRNGKFNFFVNAGLSRWEGYQILDITRKYLDPAPAKTVNSIFTQQTTMKFNNPSANLKFGMDYYLDNKNTLGFVVTGFQNKEQNTSGSNIFLEDANNVVDSIVHSPSNTKTTWKNASVNLNFRHQFDSAGRELTADADYVNYSSHSDQHFDNITYYPDMTQKGETILEGHLPSDINIWSLKTDYTHPLSKDFKLEAGLKTSYVATDNTAGYFNIVNDHPEVDTTKTNRFRYNENINAAYLNLSRQLKKWSVQLGLRFENTNYSGHQLGNGTQTNGDSLFRKSYTDLFPTAYISYQANKKNSFSLNYGRRIDRPAYQDLNPFLFFLDQYTYQAGNPYLQPQFTHNIELSHTYNNFLTTTLNYSYTKNFFSETFQQDEHATIVRRGNIGSRQNGGISVSAQVPVAKWFTSILWTDLNYTEFKGLLYGENLDISATTLQMNLNNQFTFSHGWGGEISGYYQTKAIEGQVVVNPLGQASAAVSKKLLKDKASLKLGIRDIFYTQQAKGYLNFQQTEATFHNSRDSRVVSLTFSYRFGKPLKSSGGRHNSGASDEQSRVKTGGGN